MSTVVGLYLIGTLAAALVAILVNYIFPLKLTLANVAESDLSAPEGVAEVFKDLLLKVVDNPVNAIASANYIGVFGLGSCLWACDAQCPTNKLKTYYKLWQK